jgi:hypothetical protein
MILDSLADVKIPCHATFPVKLKGGGANLFKYRNYSQVKPNNTLHKQGIVRLFAAEARFEMFGKLIGML